MNQEPSNTPKQPTEWHGLPRETIDWNPTVDESKCIGCGMCITSCGKKVYDYDYETHKVVVARPTSCMVGCTTCQVTCLQDAINFPDKQTVKELIRKEHLLTQTKRLVEAHPELYSMKK